MLKKLMLIAFQQEASDLHLSANRPAYLRKGGVLCPITKENLPQERLRTELLAILTEKEKREFQRYGAIDFAYSFHPKSALKRKIPYRLRGHYFQNLNGITAIFRLIPDKIRTLQEISAPPICQQLLQQKSGLILITGATGSGKSTTLTAMIEAINQTKERHIITIEDPIEQLYHPKKSLIEQRELHRHTPSFESALKNALRADPDIILIGELRDKSSVHLALQAAETGHLVLSTLHTNSAPKAVDRLLSYYGESEREMVRIQLSETLLAVIAQQLINIEQNIFALFEVMVVNSAISHLIRENKLAQIASNIETGRESGMQTYRQHLEFLQKSGIISDLLAKKAHNLL
ncbi:type IV pilus twitching motility protein PilT [Ignatzschineria cameli]|uniref:Twitching motility protein PilT n=1 Tax=Ignatzschineria cameli TaxID=2182793 RepID=A0A2U2ASE4_9GAMM|nr:PilT/PilU family type 4a pilus ATPase [Ignatzschineria cameli]PWD87164.1 twitching motility protein PilT [Ignatzschineria cameli]PWD92137.1 twitching motility protein PilT [Ignatzschineria cameli]PWD93278.1 twitching motility protein PilT [Ignatzschineria cameli]PWD94020.1 twitching motility protein PilT [Ignatzschineria cameli]